MPRAFVLMAVLFCALGSVRARCSCERRPRGLTPPSWSGPILGRIDGDSAIEGSFETQTALAEIDTVNPFFKIEFHK